MLVYWRVLKASGSDATFADTLCLEEDPSGCGGCYARDVGKCFRTL